MIVKQENIILAPANGEPTATIILLHGLGGDSEDILPIASMLQRADLGIEALRFVLPTAPTAPVSLNNNMPVPTWYDIIHLDPPQVDCAGAEEAMQRLDELIRQDAGVPPEKVILMGFSQGGSVVLSYGLGGSQKVAAIVGLSCFIPPCSRRINDKNRSTPFLLSHGINDDVVPLHYAEESARELQGYDCELRTYPHGHHIHQEQVDDIAKWLREKLNGFNGESFK